MQAILSLCKNKWGPCVLNCIATLMLALPASLSAHPHAWVDMNTYINSDATHITSLHMTWAFDAETSMYMLQGEDISPEQIDKTLQTLATSVVDNMYNEHYFTYLYNGKTPIRYKAATDAHLIQDKDKLVLSFEVPLSKPINFKNNDFKLVIYDQTYYVDMSWIRDSDVQLSETLQSQCTGKVIEPSVSDSQRAYTMSLASDVAPDNELGEIFSQKYQLHCQ